MLFTNLNEFSIEPFSICFNFNIKTIKIILSNYINLISNSNEIILELLISQKQMLCSMELMSKSK